MLHLAQIRNADGTRAVVAITAGGAAVVPGFAGTYDLATAAIRAGRSLAAEVAAAGSGAAVDMEAALAERRVLAPIDHRDPAHMLVTGTGLSHLGSAEGRDKMHKDLADPSKLSDSMKMFRMGLEGGKPQGGARGVQPEWFYKGDGGIVAGPEAPLHSPDFALDGGEEPEIVGIYVIGPEGTPFRIGFALGNEFSDHVTERQNYLYLAHSKLRACALGGELLTGALPGDVHGTSRIRRDGAVVWERPFLSGEDNMSHSIANLEAHHFKYALFRRPGDVHVHFFGTATLSFSDAFATRPGDLFEIKAAPFTLPLRNRLEVQPAPFAHIAQL
ncbi:MAG: FAH family protein [Alphaproteobacteria bacterium]|nr:FAH family protein [Alphaproteobacteria bacterium]